MSHSSRWLIRLGGLYFLAVGGFYTASLILSPTIEIRGLVTDLRISGNKSRDYFLTLAVEGKPKPELKVSRNIFAGLGVNDSISLTSRAWDGQPTRVEVLAGRQRGWVWEEGFSEVVMGPVCLVLGIGVVWALTRDFRIRGRRRTAATT